MPLPLLRSLAGEVRWQAGMVADRIRDALGPPPDCEAAAPDGRASPRRLLRFELAGKDGWLCYGAPSVGGRRVFGGTVPWGELWRTGADEPTVLYLPVRARIAGIGPVGGRVSLYTVPDPAGWEVVVNRSVRQWGLTRDERGRKGTLFRNAYVGRVRRAEVGRAPVEAVPAPLQEVLSFDAEPAGTGVDLVLRWERTEVRIPVTIGR